MMQAINQEQNIERVFGVNHHITFPPVAQQRHRIARINTRIRLYDPTQRAKLLFRSVVMRYLETSFNISSEDYPLTDSYVSVNVTFLISRPINHFIQKNRNNGIDPRFERTMPTTQGDIDNFVKFFLDAIDGTFFTNDRDVVVITASKLYTTEAIGRVVFNVRQHETEIIDLTEN
jgi:Holliday junction resolvase RusA-like endonuclease